MFCKTCPICQGTWMRNATTGEMEFYWSTGKKGGPQGEKDLASLTCRPFGDPHKCINPQRNSTGGDTWEARKKFIDDNDPHEGKGFS